jgi:hypothetical protein
MAQHALIFAQDQTFSAPAFAENNFELQCDFG